MTMKYVEKSYLVTFLFIIFFSSLIAFATSYNTRKKNSNISCYTCNSRNRTNAHCHDPFNPAMANYTESCKVPKQNHIGEFPARFCVKVIGKTVSYGEELVIRTCSLENMDNQCGTFKFESDTLQGCILTCDYDGCNGSMTLSSHLTAQLTRILYFLTALSLFTKLLNI